MTGTWLSAPTASGQQFGNGRWRALQTIGYRYSLPEISNGSFFQFIARYAFDFEGDSNHNHTSELQVPPSLNISLPDDWYITFFPSTDIRYKFIRLEWFVPFNFEVRKQWNKVLMTGIEIGVPFFETPNPVYRFKIEAHIGLRF